MQRWRNSFATHGINDVRRVNMSHGKVGDIEFTMNYRNSAYESVIIDRQIRGGGIPRYKTIAACRECYY